MKEEYKQLLKIVEEIQVIDQISMLLGWDQQTMMPPKAVEQRGEQMAYITKLSHEMSTDPKIGQLLKKVKNHPDYDNLSDLEKRNIYLIQREYDKATKVPTEFMVKYTKQSVISQEVWKKAKKQNDFDMFKPNLKKMIELGKEFANYLDPDSPPYDVMLDYFEPGMNEKKYNEIFKPLKEASIKLLEKIEKAEHQPNTNILKKEVPIEIQKKLTHSVVSYLNYDLDRGRIDEAAHPFTTGDYDDVRITTKYTRDYFPGAFFATMHEAGHACYNQNLKEELRYQPVGNYCSMGVHEANSRFYENIIGRSLEFWTFYFDKFREITGDLFSGISFENFIHSINKVEPSPIRVEADELTYNLHIILRFELEKGLIEGDIDVEDLPELWNKKMKKMLNYEVKNDREGVLQDIHWSGGMVGYFPTYSMGNIYGAQFFTKLKKDIPDWNVQLKAGNVDVITNWIKTNVQEKGNLFDPAELVKEVTGEEPTAKYLIEYLNEKFSNLYKI